MCWNIYEKRGMDLQSLKDASDGYKNENKVENKLN